MAQNKKPYQSKYKAEDFEKVVETLFKDSVFGGVAHPNDPDPKPVGNTVYLASEVGTYTNYGGVKMTEEGVAVIGCEVKQNNWTLTYLFRSDSSKFKEFIDNFTFTVEDDGIILTDGLGNVGLKINNDSINVLNIDSLFPKENGYYCPEEARAVIPNALKKVSLIITYKTGETSNTIEQYIGKNIATWDDSNSWRNINEEFLQKDILPGEYNEGFAITDNDGNVAFVVDSRGILHANLEYVESQEYPREFIVSDMKGNVGLRVDEHGNLSANIAGKKLPKQTINNPDYIFGIDTGKKDREYIASLYAESFSKREDKTGTSYGIMPDIRVNGQRQVDFQSHYDIHVQEPTERVHSKVYDLTISRDGYEDYNARVEYIKAKRTNGENKNIFLLPIGDSTTGNAIINPLDGRQYIWESCVAEMALMDIADGVAIKKFLLLGTEKGVHESRDVSFQYKGETISYKFCCEGRGGSTSYDNANIPFRVYPYLREDAPDYSFDVMYYLLGLSTKTPFDSPEDVKGVNTGYVMSDASQIEIMNTPFGRYKPENYKLIWEVFRDFYSFYGYTFEGAYDPSTSDVYLDEFFEHFLNNPSIPFYSKDRARERTANGEWKYETAFSVDALLSRYRTMNDNGERLYFDTMKNTSGTPGTNRGYLVDGTPATYTDGSPMYIGTKVSNTETFNLCCPTHIIDALGVNDGKFIDEARIKLQLSILDSIKKDCPDAFVGYFIVRPSGVINANNWNDIGVARKVVEWSVLHREGYNLGMQKALGKLQLGKVNYIPSWYAQFPFGSDGDRIGLDWFGNKKIIAGGDQTHISAISHKSIAYQCLSWIYWTLQ